ncbi:uncharacterized protein FA14DRAFT_185269 [Meira miltonrushii]|uniref:Uncharacterized protein n=1 Tax=Meira miltonrushii TaxID=1280837 RepID=A0A316V945_9BASI|nr:uncharacterized protein FA14DRAFT_185269 [Meira miltonrushii]PWN33558.1 hypothetical protein FA14DRAFT_185269 [Meira miltonrushii]
MAQGSNLYHRTLPSKQRMNDHINIETAITSPDQGEKEVTKKRKRSSSRKYNFPPGTTRKERNRVYKKAHYASMSPSRKADYLAKVKVRESKPEVKLAISIKRKEWYHNLSKDRKEEYSKKVLEAKKRRLERLSAEERQAKHLERNAIERDRHRRKKAEALAKESQT